MAKQARCTACMAPLRWETTENGRPIALNPRHDPKGNFVLREKGPNDVRACALRKGEDTNETRYMIHVATCIYRDRIAKARAGKQRGKRRG